MRKLKLQVRSGRHHEEGGGNGSRVRNHRWHVRQLDLPGQHLLRVQLLGLLCLHALRDLRGADLQQARLR